MGRLFALAAAALACQAHAGVVYNWQTLDQGGATSSLVGRLELDESAWRTGQIDYTFRPWDWYQYGDPHQGDPLAPVIGLTFYLENDSVALGLTYRDGTGFGDYQPSGFTITMTRDGIEGNLWSGGTGAAINMSGGETLWHINSMFAEDQGDLCWRDICPGSLTGRWVLDASTVPRDLPEPHSAAIVLLAMALSSRSVKTLHKH